jgi:hypothetical protein
MQVILRRSAFACLVAGSVGCREHDNWIPPTQLATAEVADALIPDTGRAAAAPPPRPAAPGYGEYMALEPSDRIFDHYAHLTLELLRVRTRLERLDEHKYVRWIRDYDQEIRALMAIWCADALAGYGGDLAHTPIADLFPLQYVESAVSARCGGLWVGGKIQRGRAWMVGYRGIPDAGP